MVTKHGFKYRGFLLHRDPMQNTDGRFDPRIKITLGESQLYERDYLSNRPLEREDEAIRIAREWGEHWVDDYLGDD